MLLQHGESKGQPANAASCYWKKERERKRDGEEREKKKKREKKEKLEIEHIFVTYLPIGWVQTNKMEKVKVIPWDEWISLDIYLQRGYSKSPAWLITVTFESVHSQITIAGVFFFPPLHHIIHRLQMRAGWLHPAKVFCHVLSSKRMCLWPPKGLFLHEPAFFFDPFHQLK